jgi:hypothetical protein
MISHNVGKPGGKALCGTVGGMDADAERTTAMDGGSAVFAGAKNCQGCIHSVSRKGLSRPVTLDFEDREQSRKL